MVIEKMMIILMMPITVTLVKTRTSHGTENVNKENDDFPRKASLDVR